MKNFILLGLLLSCATFFGCTIGEIETITYNNVTERVFITLDENNYVDKSTIISKIRLTKGSFTAEQITFDIPGFSIPSTSYTLDDFSPSLDKGKTYYFVFEKGAFGNYGEWLNYSDIDWESEASVYKLDYK